ncbi:MAG: phenylalanine--tRNA ligase subunit alpha [Peptostreptococcaceae bacterium]|nr:phenylalanine--tRNA ligase subunit alpha [Peptostreptococcaceae bacterium]
MKDRLLKLKEQAIQELSSVNDLSTIENLRVKFLGKKNELANILKEVGKLPADERPKIGMIANEIRADIENKIEQMKKEIKLKTIEQRIQLEKIDVTIPAKTHFVGKQHPILLAMSEIEEIFMSMGFSIEDGPEVETVENSFDHLNSPKFHPSREMSDTFYFSENIVLRPHTSTVQIRTMKNQKPPIRMISLGRCFRYDTPDATHSPMFHQVEGLVVDKNITFANLKDTLEIFIKQMFGEEIKAKFRPHNFPFTEPSAEVDITCFKCHGEGCPVCKQEGWIEILGAGMVHPNVLSNCGIDPNEYSGFAFGMGIDRIAMLKYGIEDIRLLYENDLRFLKQF